MYVGRYVWGVLFSPLGVLLWRRAKLRASKQAREQSSKQAKPCKIPMKNVSKWRIGHLLWGKTLCSSRWSVPFSTH